MIPLLVEMNLNAENDEQAIRILSAKLMAENFVSEFFADEVCLRERSFPTGLNFDGFGVAIPHTDPCHVNQECYSIGKLKNPIAFKSMGDPETSVFVELIIIMGIVDPDKQITAIKKIVELLSDVETVRFIRENNHEELIKDVFKPCIT